MSDTINFRINFLMNKQLSSMLLKKLVAITTYKMKVIEEGLMLTKNYTGKGKGEI